MADARHPDTLTSESTGIPRFLVLLTALGLALAVVGAALLLWPKSEGAAAEPADNVTIVNQVNKFATEYNTYDAADVKDYQDRVTPLMTEEYGQSTITDTDEVFAALVSREQKSTDAQVKQVAIQSRDADSAQVLVVVDATVTNTDLDGPNQRQMRWLLSLQREGGEWLIDAFESVPATPVDTGSAGTDPAATDPAATEPTPEPTATEGGQ